MESFQFHQLTREEISSLAKAGYAAVVPLAATEQHGPHLGVGTDSLIGGHIAREAVRKATETGRARLVLAPIVSIGCSGHHLAFGGTLSFSADTYLRMLHDIGESLVRDGFRHIIFINSHGGNAHMMNQAASDLVVRHPIRVAAASYWNAASPFMKDVLAANRGMVAGHAGRFETSAVMALDEAMVRKDRVPREHEELPWLFAGPPGAFYGVHGKLTGNDGFTDASAESSAEQGREQLATIVDGVAEWFASVYAAMSEEAAP
ncbi:MAG: creatininase family protein [Paenibacillaceae bacterium]|nr:creatininase family protein [Paenibacillaceae bacterium]